MIGDINVYAFMRFAPLAHAAYTFIPKPSPVSFKTDQVNPEKGHKRHCRHNAEFKGHPAHAHNRQQAYANDAAYVGMLGDEIRNGGGVSVIEIDESLANHVVE